MNLAKVESAVRQTKRERLLRYNSKWDFLIVYVCVFVRYVEKETKALYWSDERPKNRSALCACERDVCVCAEHKRNSGEYELWRTKPFTYMRVYAVPDQAQAHVLNT